VRRLVYRGSQGALDISMGMLVIESCVYCVNIGGVSDG
jgi:hypothetical protein